MKKPKKRSSPSSRARAEARSLSSYEVAAWSEEQAHQLATCAKFPRGKPACTSCGEHSVAEIRTRRRWRCTRCRSEFTIFSGTGLHRCRLGIKRLVYAAMVFSTPSNGISDTDMAFHCKLSLKTANGLSHKFREGMVRQRNSLILSGRVQMDGSFYAGVVRPANLKANRRNRRRQQKESGKQRCVIALVETRRNGRSVALAALNESADVVVPIARRFLSKGARVRTDDNGAYNRVSTYFEHKTVSHRKGFFLKGRHTNNVESFFKRMRGLQGVYHRVGRNLDAYAAEASWRANYARAPADKRLFQLLQLVLTKAETSRWRGCRQRGANRKAMPEVLWGPKLPTKN